MSPNHGRLDVSSMVVADYRQHRYHPHTHTGLFNDAHSAKMGPPRFPQPLGCPGDLPHLHTVVASCSNSHHDYNSLIVHLQLECYHSYFIMKNALPVSGISIIMCRHYVWHPFNHCNL